MSKKRGFDKGKVSRKIGDLREEKSVDKRGLERRKVSTKRGLERGKVDLESHHAPRCHHPVSYTHLTLPTIYSV